MRTYGILVRINNETIVRKNNLLSRANYALVITILVRQISISRLIGAPTSSEAL